MIDSFNNYVNRYKLFEPHHKILLTVSGGIDSMVMLDLFMKSGFRAGIAHCNFRLRGEESDADEKFVAEVTNLYGCQLYTKMMDAKGYSQKHKVSLQMAARSLRYAWFEELIDETDFDLYATAHHLDDQIETFFINLFRGTGINGLRGIPPKTGSCIRPLLFADRNMVEVYARENGLKYREDSSNAKNDYLRNRIRHFIVPAMENAEPTYKTGFQHTFDVLSSTTVFIEEEMKRKKRNILHQKENSIYISIEKLEQEKYAEFVLYELLKPNGYNFTTIHEILNTLGKPSGKRFLSKTHELFVDRKFLILKEIQTQSTDEGEIMAGQDEIKNPIHLKLSDFNYKNQQIPTTPSVAWLDYDKLNFPLKIRNYNVGDYFVPLGMKGRKKLSDFFIDRKIPVPEKQNIKVLSSGNEIAWVIGHQIDNRFKITSSTKHVFAAQII